MNVALVGCGFVADYYLQTLPLHPELHVCGVHDRIAERAQRLSAAYHQRAYGSLESLLSDRNVDLVLNLTNPREHYAISRAALEHGKHVYSEKPLAMEFAQARELFELANREGLMLAGAPCSVLGETAQTMWKALRHNVVGPVRIVYAEMDDGMVHLMPYRRWISTSGVPWPYKDEFEVGCTLEHAGYCVSWLAAWFGPASRVTAFGSTRIPNKLTQESLSLDSPDFTVACIEFANGVVARLTCGIVAPHNHQLMVVGDAGILCTDETWHYRSAVYSRRLMNIRRKTFLSPFRTRHSLLRSPYKRAKTAGAQKMDFARGPAEMAAALREGRACRLSPSFSLHVNELALAIHHSRSCGATYQMSTTFDLVEPMPWAA